MSLNISDMMSKVSQAKGKMEEAAKRAGDKSVTSTVAGGMVSVTANGRQEIVRIQIEDALLSDKAMLQDLVTAAVNQALTQSKSLLEQEMAQVMQSLGLPPGFSL